MSDIARSLSMMSQGRANPSDFQLVLPANVLSLSPEFESANDYIRYFCRAITLPSMSNSMMSIKGQENVGINRNMVTGRSFGSPVVFTFTDRKDLMMYSILKRWMDSAVLNSDQTNNADRSLRVNYYNSVREDISIFKLEPEADDYLNPNTQRDHKITGIWTLKNAVPMSIEQSTLSMEAADSLMDFTISIAYESFSFTSRAEDMSLGNSLFPVSSGFVRGAL